MTALNNVSRYRSAYDDDYEDEPQTAELHPHVRKQAQQIVHRERMTRFYQWWISLVGGVAIVASAVGVVLGLLGLPLIAAAAGLGAGMMVLYLVSLALKVPAGG